MEIPKTLIGVQECQVCGNKMEKVKNEDAIKDIEKRQVKQQSSRRNSQSISSTCPFIANLFTYAAPTGLNAFLVNISINHSHKFIYNLSSYIPISVVKLRCNSLVSAPYGRRPSPV